MHNFSIIGSQTLSRIEMVAHLTSLQSGCKCGGVSERATILRFTDDLVMAQTVAIGKAQRREHTHTYELRAELSSTIL